MNYEDLALLCCFFRDICYFLLITGQGIQHQPTPDLLVNGKSLPRVPASVPPPSIHYNNPNQLNIPPPGPTFTHIGKAGLEIRPGLPVPSQVMGVSGHVGVGMVQGAGIIPGVPAGVMPGGPGVGMIQGAGGVLLGAQRTPVAQGIGMMPSVQAGGMMQGAGMMQEVGMVQGAGMVPHVQAGGLMQGIPGARILSGAGGIPGVQVTGMTQGVQGMMPGAYGVGITQNVQRIPGAQVTMTGVQRSGGIPGVQGVGMMSGVSGAGMMQGPAVGMVPGAPTVGMMSGVLMTPGGVVMHGVQTAGIMPGVGGRTLAYQNSVEQYILETNAQGVSVLMPYSKSKQYYVTFD